MTNELTLASNFSLSSIDDYLSTVGRIPRLDAEEELNLAKRFRDLNDLEAARTLVLANLRFVAHVAKGYLGYGLPLPDLIQEGNIGLMKAVKRYDPEVGVRLVSFAVHWIRAEIHEFIIQNWRIVKIATTKTQRKLFFNLRKYKNRIGWLSADEASIVAGELGVDVESVFEMESRLTSQDLAFDSDSESENDEHDISSPSHYLYQENGDPSDIIELSDWDSHKQNKLHEAMASLDERSRDILNCRWLNDEKLTLQDLAARYNVSAERIRQLENSALKRIRLNFAA